MAAPVTADLFDAPPAPEAAAPERRAAATEAPGLAGVGEGCDCARPSTEARRRTRSPTSPEPAADAEVTIAEVDAPEAAAKTNAQAKGAYPKVSTPTREAAACSVALAVDRVPALGVVGQEEHPLHVERSFVEDGAAQSSPSPSTIAPLALALWRFQR